MAVRTGAFEKVGVFNEALRFHVDQEMWIRILLRGDAYFLSPPLVSVRQHDGSETRRLERAKQIDSDTLSFLTICLQNEQIRSLLSESELAELDRRRESLSRATSQTHNRLVLGMLRSKTPPYIKRALYPLYKKLFARAKDAGRDS